MSRRAQKMSLKSLICVKKADRQFLASDRLNRA